MLSFVIVVLFLFVSSSFGEANIGFKGVGAKVGYISPEGGLGGTIAFGALADLGYIMQALGLEAHFTYWSKSYDVLGADASVNSISLDAVVKYYFAPEDKSLRPFAGGGLGFSRAGWKAGGFDGSDTNLNIVLNAGARNNFSEKIAGIAEFRYVISGDWDYWGIFASFLYVLGQ